MIPVDVSIQKLPPQNIEAEQAVLAAILLDNQAINKVVETLRVEDFYKESHRRIFSAMLEMNEKNEAVDLYEVFDAEPPELRELKQETQNDLAKAQRLYSEKQFAEAQVQLF